MNNINNKINICINYFNGFKDIQDKKKVYLGILKIATYFTGIFPLIFGIIYSCENLKKRKLEVITKKIESDDEVVTQAEILKYIFMKFADKDFDKFQDGFKKLELKTQELFFVKMYRKNRLEETMKQLPKDIKKLQFDCGNFSTRNVKKCRKFANQFLRNLPIFEKLEELNLNLRGLGFFTDTAQRKVKRANTGILGGEEFIQFCDGGAWYNYHNSSIEINTALFMLKKFLERNKDLAFQLNLKNVEISRGNYDARATDRWKGPMTCPMKNEDGTLQKQEDYALTIMEYLGLDG